LVNTISHLYESTKYMKLFEPFATLFSN